MVLAVVILLVGCSQPALSVEKQQKREGPERIEKASPGHPSPDLPAYDVTFERDCAETGVVGKCYGVSTDATCREELEVLTADLWLDSPGYLAVLVTFYPKKSTADVSATGFAFHEPGGPGPHTGVRVTKDEQEELKQRLDGEGIAWRERDHGIAVGVFFEDPDGRLLEAIAYRRGDDPRRRG